MQVVFAERAAHRDTFGRCHTAMVASFKIEINQNYRRSSLELCKASPDRSKSDKVGESWWKGEKKTASWTRDRGRERDSTRSGALRHGGPKMMQKNLDGP